MIYTIIGTAIGALFFYVKTKEETQGREMRARALALQAEAKESAKTNDEIRAVLIRLWRYLDRRRVGAYAPWVQSCIAAIDGKRACPPDVALAALVETAEDLKGTRWETDEMAGVFAEAAGELSRML